MRLTRYTDHALRVLIHLAQDEHRLCSVGEIARAYGLSRGSLVKVVNALAREDFVATSRGRKGGVRLARSAREIGVGDVVRLTESGFQISDGSDRAWAPACALSQVLAEGMSAMLTVFEDYTIADLRAAEHGTRSSIACKRCRE